MRTHHEAQERRPYIKLHICTEFYSSLLEFKLMKFVLICDIPDTYRTSTFNMRCMLFSEIQALSTFSIQNIDLDLTNYIEAQNYKNF